MNRNSPVFSMFIIVALTLGLALTVSPAGKSYANSKPKLDAERYYRDGLQ